MKRFSKHERFTSRAARDRGDAPALLTNEELLHDTTLELLRPIAVDGIKELTEITITCPTVDAILDQQLQVEANKEQTLKSLANVVTELEVEHVRKMHPFDFNKLSQIYWAYNGS